MSTVTWGDIAQGDTIRADDGSLWHVEWTITDVDYQRTQVGIHDTDRRETVTYGTTDPVERVEPRQMQWPIGGDPTPFPEQAPIYAPPDDVKRNLPVTVTWDQEAVNAGIREAAEAATLLEDKLGATETASETAAETKAHEAATAQDPEVLPEITEPLMLRGHLYLVHGLSVSQVPAGAEAATMLTELHATGHQTGPSPTPHVHKPEEK